MAEYRHETLRRLFDLVIAAAPGDRGPILDRECGGDSGLRARVEAMVAAAEDDRFLAEPTRSDADMVPTADASATAATLTATLREGPGTKIGPYKLLQLIGEGGFGSVFMAEQEKPVARRVALKIIKLGMDTQQVVARFEQERQALAMMDHPHIAKVLDAGATETGRPYFVMELVKGDPIAEYADKHNMSIDERLALFAQVCNAVQHAHTKGIIHRDIKPSNVLVSTQDGRPHARVIDFGIAKATLSKLTERTLFTEHRQLIGTPEYMSPEQAEGSLDIDTRTDVYSLGVLLYELLTGTTPFTSRELRSAAYAEIQRIIREVEPPRPSTRLSNNAETLASVAARRRTEPGRLGSLVRGELDWIVMKALEKDRQRRYETPSGLAADINRYLSGEAVVAAPPSTSYRFQKFVRRNKGPVLAGSAVAAALVFGFAGTAWQAKVASAQRDMAVAAQAAEAEQRQAAEAARAEALEQKARAEANEAEARKQEAEAKSHAAIAEAVATFQTEMLAAVDPSNLPRDPATGEPLKDRVTVLQAMEAAIRKLDADDAGAFKDQPLMEAGVRSTIGSTLLALGRAEDAVPILRRSLELRRAALPEGGLIVAASMNNLAAALELAGTRAQTAEAESLLRQALEIYRKALPAGHRLLTTSINNLGSHLLLQEKATAAEPLFREAIEAYRAAPDCNPRNLAAALDNLAKSLLEQNRAGEAESFMREALEIRRTIFPAQHPEIALGLNNLAGVYQMQRKHAQAERLYREAIAMRRATLPAGHLEIGISLHNLGSVLRGQDRFAEAEPVAREALAIRRAALPAGHPDIAASLNSLALTLKEQKRLDEAEPLYREALEIRRAALPAGHPDIAGTLNNLAILLKEQDKLEEAEPLYRESLEIRRASLPPGHPSIATALHNLGQLLRLQNKPGEAEPLYREALEIRRAALPAGHESIAHTLGALSGALQAQGKFAEAEPPAAEALESIRASLPAGHEKIADALSNLAAVQQGLGRSDQARANWDEAIRMLREGSPQGSANLARWLWRSGGARLENNDHAAALVELEEAVAMGEKFLGPEDRQLARYRETLAECRAAMAK
ncbi:MAG: serine/threonine protein kinase [Phycisphaerales bacterium]|nr:serine/threonine protein kinase [Phycisphaerales bacterium]